MAPRRQGNFLKKTLAVLSTTIMLGLGNVIAIPTVKAESIQQQISKANSTIATAQDNLARSNGTNKSCYRGN